MKYCNNEQYLSFQTAVDCIKLSLNQDSSGFFYEAMLVDELPLFTHITDLCTLLPPAQEPQADKRMRVSGLCSLLIECDPFDSTSESLILKVVKETGEKYKHYLNWTIYPLELDIRRHNYKDFSYISFSSFFLFLLKVDIEITYQLLSFIMSRDPLIQTAAINSNHEPLTIIKEHYQWSTVWDVDEDIIDASIENAISLIQKAEKKSNKNQILSVNDETPLNTRERDNLYKIIGLLTFALNEKSGNTLKIGDKISSSAVASQLERFIQGDTAGLSSRSLREKIKQGMDLVTSD